MNTILAETVCCHRDRLQKVLDGLLTDQEEALVTSHLDLCPSCRQHLESIAAPEHWWRESHTLLTGQKLQRDSPALPADEQSQLWLAANETERYARTFLTPCDNPDLLGRLGQFEILEFIGSGGMGLVLKGYDHELNRTVAIKVLAPHYAEHSEARRRFVREAQAAAAIMNPHVVAIHTVDPGHHPPYFVMAFVPGESLHQRVNRTGPIPVPEVLRISQEIATGLAAAHLQGVVHRDVKPANILLERGEERVLITDFGLARTADDASLTQTGLIAGTPQYMSPEQIHGESIDARADLFSLGCVMYTMLVGHSPFRADSAYAVMRRVTDSAPIPLREINGDVPVWLDVFVERLLAKHPDDRWQSAQRVSELLRQCLAHNQQPAGVHLPPEIVQLVKKRRSCHSHRFRLIAAILLVSIFSLCVMVMFGRQHLPTPATESTSNIETPAPIRADLDWEDQHEVSQDAIDQALQSLEAESEF